MVTKTITEQRAEVRIFAGNESGSYRHRQQRDFLGNTALTAPDADEATGKLWSGTDRKPVVRLAYWYCRLKAQRRSDVLQVGDLCDGGIRWPDSVDDTKKANAFAGSALKSRGAAVTRYQAHAVA